MVSLISISAYSQIQTISFEPSEGYSLNNIIGQQGWESFEVPNPNAGRVINTSATNGANSMNFINTNSNAFGGVEKHVAGYRKTEYSFDFKIDAIGSSYTMMAFDEEYKEIGKFSVDGVTGMLRYHYYAGGFDFLNGVLDSGIILTPGTWYNLKMIIDLDNINVSYYVNNVLIDNTMPPPSSWKPFDRIHFSYNDSGSDFSVDNIKIINPDATLGTSDTSLQNIVTISPNPTSDFINIKSSDKISSVEVVDASGKIVLKDTRGENQIRISELPNGIYIVKIDTTKQSLIKKIIKK